jgi:hypothetical protein
MNNRHIEIASYRRLNITLSNPVYMVEIEYKCQIQQRQKINQNKQAQSIKK